MYSILDALRETKELNLRFLSNDVLDIGKEVQELNARATKAGLIYRITVDQVSSVDLDSALVPDDSENDEDYTYDFSGDQDE